MWKDFFYYSKSERRAVVFLLILIAVAIGSLLFSPYLIETADEEEKQASFDEMERFLASVSEIEKERRTTYTHKTYARKREILLAPFDPNLADSTELVQLGLPSFIAHNILRYRKAGGKFATPEAFSRIYGLRDEQFQRLKPYIYISDAFQKKQDTLQRVRKIERDTLYKHPEGVLVDLNTADTTELKKIPGIGSGIARMIVAYRQRLGGFYAVAQVEEIDYVTPEMVRWFTLKENTIRRIHVNKASLDKLRSHPYMNFYRAKVILDYRKKRGKLKSLSQLALYEEFTEKDLARLAHYFAFD